jgi:hypothetical protein
MLDGILDCNQYYKDNWLATINYKTTVNFAQFYNAGVYLHYSADRGHKNKNSLHCYVDAVGALGCQQEGRKRKIFARITAKSPR